MARIVSIATCLPPHQLSGAQTEELLRRHLARAGQPPDFFVKILRSTQIETRHTVYGPDEVVEEHGLAERNELYIRTCIELGERGDKARRRTALSCSEIVNHGDKITIGKLTIW